MNLTQLLHFYSFVVPLFCILWDGWKQHGGLGLLIGLPFGLVLGFACFSGTRGLVRWIASHPQLGKSDAAPVWVFASWGLFIAVLIWISAVSWLGISLTERVIASVAY